MESTTSPRQHAEGIHIGVVSTSYPMTPESVSGIFVFRLLQHLPGEIASKTVITPASSEALELPPIQPGTIVVSVRYGPRRWQELAHRGGGIPAALAQNRWRYLLLPLLLLSMFLACFRLARKFDLIHAHWAVNGVVSGLVGKLTRTPVVTTLRGSDVNLATRSSIHRFILRLCIRLCTKLVAVSDSLVSVARQQNPDVAKEKFHVIQNGIDDVYYDIKRLYHSGSSTLGIITVGNLTANKGIDQILRALHILGDTSLHLRIVGDGPERERLSDLALTLNLNRQVEFTGAVSPSRIPQLLAAADIFVLASHSEGRSNALMEAMAAALPVIASDISGIHEVITNGVNGLLFHDGDIHDLAHRISNLVHAPSHRYALGAAARQSTLESGLRWSATAERYSALYRQVLSETLTKRKR